MGNQPSCPVKDFLILVLADKRKIHFPVRDSAPALHRINCTIYDKLRDVHLLDRKIRSGERLEPFQHFGYSIVPFYHRPNICSCKGV